MDERPSSVHESWRTLIHENCHDSIINFLNQFPSHTRSNWILRPLLSTQRRKSRASLNAWQWSLFHGKMELWHILDSYLKPKEKTTLSIQALAVWPLFQSIEDAEQRRTILHLLWNRCSDLDKKNFFQTIHPIHGLLDAWTESFIYHTFKKTIRGVLERIDPQIQHCPTFQQRQFKTFELLNRYPHFQSIPSSRFFWLYGFSSHFETESLCKMTSGTPVEFWLYFGNLQDLQWAHEQQWPLLNFEVPYGLERVQYYLDIPTSIHSFGHDSDLSSKFPSSCRVLWRFHYVNAIDLFFSKINLLQLNQSSLRSGLTPEDLHVFQHFEHEQRRDHLELLSWWTSLNPPIHTPFFKNKSLSIIPEMFCNHDQSFVQYLHEHIWSQPDIFEAFFTPQSIESFDGLIEETQSRCLSFWHSIKHRRQSMDEHRTLLGTLSSPSDLETLEPLSRFRL